MRVHKCKHFMYVNVKMLRVFFMFSAKQQKKKPPSTAQKPPPPNLHVGVHLMSRISKYFMRVFSRF